MPPAIHHSLKAKVQMHLVLTEIHSETLSMSSIYHIDAIHGNMQYNGRFVTFDGVCMLLQACFIGTMSPMLSALCLEAFIPLAFYTAARCSMGENTVPRTKVVM